MAIVKMKRLTLLAMQRDREELLECMQRMQCVQVTALPEDVQSEQDRAGGSDGAQTLDSLKWALQKLARYDKQPKPMFNQYPEVGENEVQRLLSEKDSILALVHRLKEIERTRGDLRAEETRIKTSRDQYLPWKELDATAEQLSSTRTLQLCGTVPSRSFDHFRESVETLPVTIRAFTRDPENTYFYIAAHESCQEEVRAALNAAGFTQENFTALEGKTPAQYLQYLDDEAKRVEDSRAALLEEERNMADRIGDIKILHDLTALDLKRREADNLSAETEKTFLLQGWVPEAMAESVRKKLLAVSPSASIEITDPKEDESPSVLLKNGPFTTAFEPVVEGFSLPSYHGIDPSAVMAPFYVCLFGMMVSDAGYGLLMALVILAFVKIKKIKLKNAKMLYLLIFGGFSTVIWGLAFNTVMGFNPLPQMSPCFPLDAVNNPMPVMAVCLGIGALHMFAGLGVAAYMNLRKGDVLAAVSDQLSWFVLLVGLGLMALPATKAVGQYMALAGCAVIILMAGREKKNPFKRLLSGLGALYGVTGWVSDLLSYMRLFGMGLATGVIGMVFNILIGMVWSGGIVGKLLAVVLFIVCHLFNLGINALGAYVHSCRLQYIEFFGKFYEDGGRPFLPLDLKTRYVSIQRAEAP